jgi:hypothetical protein
MEQKGRVEQAAPALVMLSNMLPDTSVTAGRLLVRTLEKRRTFVTNVYVPHDILIKKGEIKYVLQNFGRR